MSGLDGNPIVCCTAAQCPTGQTAGESAVCYRSTCPEGKNPLTSGVRAIKNILPTPREPREGAPSPLRCLDLTARQGKTRLLALSRRRLRIIKRSFMRPGYAKWNRARERPRKAASGATGAQRDPCPRSTSVTALATLHQGGSRAGGALMRRYRAQAPADKHAGRARRLRSPLIRSSLHACRDHRDACRSTDYANYSPRSRIVDRGRYRKPVPRVPKPLKKAR